MKRPPILLSLCLAALLLQPTAHAEDELPKVEATTQSEVAEDVTASPTPSPAQPMSVFAAEGGAPSCAASSVYAISRDGNIFELKQGTYDQWTVMPEFKLQVPRENIQTVTCTNADPDACKKPQLNSLGVGVVNGQTVWYAVQRRTVLTSSGTYVPEIIVYRAIEGSGWVEFARSLVGRAMPSTWYRVPDDTQVEVFNQVIGGAVNPVDGSYWVLAYDAVDATNAWVGTLDTVALLYRVDPVTGEVQAKGRALIPRFAKTVRGGSNGDLYFDADGNAHIVQTLFGFDNGVDHSNLGKGETQVHIVRATDLESANASTRLKFSSGREVKLTGLDQNTGVAYEFPTGNVVISDLDSSVSFDPVNPSRQVRRNSGLRDSMDLASCSFPHTVELRKNVVGRIRDEHQFDLAISRLDSTASTVIASEVTSGSKVGVQAEHVGPVPATPNSKLVLSETLVGAGTGDDLSQYAPKIECEETSYGGQVTASPNPSKVGSYSLTMPKVPDGGTKSLHVVCTITNTPPSQPAQVKVIKKLRGAADDELLADWPFTIDVGTKNLTPVDTTLKTGADGSVRWSLPEGTVGFSEKLIADDKVYRFVSGSCERNGVAVETEFVAKMDSVSVSDLKVIPGDQLTCTFVNQEVSKGSVMFRKVDPEGQRLADSVWSLTGPDGQVESVEDCVEDAAIKCVGSDKDPEAGGFRVEDLALGDYVLREKAAPAGYLLSEDEHKFLLTTDKPDYVFEVSFTNNPILITLPLTGGLGSHIFIWAGLGLTALGAGILLKNRRII